MMKQYLGVLATALLLTLGVHAHVHADDERHAERSFALIGDVPYGTAVEAKFDNVIDSINAAPHVRFVVHNGDVKAGSERCDDA